MKSPFLITLVLIVLSQFAAAQSLSHPGIDLFKQGRHAEARAALLVAVKTKEFKNDASAWNYLGLAQSKLGDNKNARKSLEKAAKLAPGNPEIRLHLAYVFAYLNKPSNAASAVDKAISLGANDAGAYHLRGAMHLRAGKLNEADADATRAIEMTPTDSGGYILKAYVAIDRLVAGGADLGNVSAELRFLDAALDSLRDGTKKCKGDSHCAAIANEFEVVRVYRDYFAKDRSTVRPPSAPDPKVTPLKILAKPKASYTDDARQAGKQGTIRVLVLFRADGKIGRPILLNRLGAGLDQNVLEAASRMTFEPKKIDGKPVSDVRQVEYSFTIY